MSFSFVRRRLQTPTYSSPHHRHHSHRENSRVYTPNTISTFRLKKKKKNKLNRMSMSCVPLSKETVFFRIFQPLPIVTSFVAARYPVSPVTHRSYSYCSTTFATIKTMKTTLAAVRTIEETVAVIGTSITVFDISTTTN